MSIDDEPTEEERRAAEALRDSLDRRPGEGADAAHARDAETVALLRASKDEPLGQARSEGIWERILGVARVPDTKLASRWRRRPMAVAVAAVLALALYVPFKHFAGGPTATDGEPNVPVDGQTRPGRAKSTRRGGVSPALLDAERRAESSDALARDIESYELALYGHRQRWFDSLARRHGAPGGVVR